MTTWTYAPDGEVYPVEPEEVWKVGNHIITVSDLMASDLLDIMLEDQPPTLLYCDPPWGQALVNGFRTKAGLEKATYRWEELYHRIAEIGHSRRIPVWIEGSKLDSRDGQIIPSTIQPRFMNYPAYWDVTYYGRNPSGLYYAGSEPYPEPLRNVLGGMDDANTPGAVMSAYEKGVVTDPCLGLGGTALAAEKVGWASVTNELSTYRTSASLVALSKLTGSEPVRL